MTRNKEDQYLKTLPVYFEQVKSGDKTFEIRKNDRDFKVGQLVYLEEWDDQTKAYTGRSIRRQIGYIFHGGKYGIPEDFVVFSLLPAPIDNAPRPKLVHVCLDKLTRSQAIEFLNYTHNKMVELNKRREKLYIMPDQIKKVYKGSLMKPWTWLSWKWEINKEEIDKLLTGTTEEIK